MLSFSIENSFLLELFPSAESKIVPWLINTGQVADQSFGGGTYV
jgi:hypothetical protein